jgi:hypothetical protein
MVNFTGTIAVNGISDKELVKILEIKLRHEGKFQFNPQQLQVANYPGQPGSFYNNAIFSWTNEGGLQAVYEIMAYLLKKEEPAQSGAQ